METEERAERVKAHLGEMRVVSLRLRYRWTLRLYHRREPHAVAWCMAPFSLYQRRESLEQ
jgi:hypothetical protein